MPSTRILLIGAAGFIGHACAREFLSRGCGVTALMHRRPPANLDGIETAAGSLTDRQSLADALGGGPFDAVVNAAGVASDVARTSRIMAVNYHGAVNLAECMAGTRGRLVHISTTDVYGLRNFTDAGETTPLQDNLHQAYPRSKILAEEGIAATLPAERYVFLRPGVAWGAGDASILPRVIDHLRRHSRVIHFGRWRGRNRWPLAYVGNVARAAYLAATCDEAVGQAYNVVDPQVTTMEQYYRWVLRTFLPERAAMKSITLPRPLVWPLAWLSSLLSRALGRDHPLIDPSLYALYSVSCHLDFSSRKLQEFFARCGEELLTTRQAGGPP